MATGVRQQVKEFTATGRYALLDRVSVWVEFRDDWSSRSAFGRGRSPEGCGHQPTLLVGVVAILRPNG